MKLKKLLTFFILITLPSFSFAANYYVDCSAGKNGNGSYESPWNNLNAVSNKRFSNGDGLYFKVNTTCTLKSDNDRIRVNWSGTGENNRAIIGAYYGNGLFGLNGNARPIIDGGQQYPGQYQGAVDIVGQSYVTVKDLKIQYTGRDGARGVGVRVIDSNNINTENCHIYRTRGINLVYMRVDTGNIINNIAEEAKYPDFTGTGAAIEVSAGLIEGATTNILVAGNKVFNGAHEGIGLYKNVTHSIVEHNIVRDMNSYHLYNGASKYNIWRYNLVYSSTDPLARGRRDFAKGFAMASGIEAYRPGERFNGENQWYGNLVANMGRGISLGCQIALNEPDAFCHPNEKIYNNTFVDVDVAFTLWNPDSRDHIDIKNNISYIITEDIGSRHISTGSGGHSPPGVNWSHNLFYGGPSVTGNAASNMVKENPMLAKKSGWRSLSPDSLAGAEFLPDNGKVLDKGMLIKNYTRFIASSNFKSSPIKVSINNNQSGPIPVGAWTNSESANPIEPEDPIEPPHIDLTTK